MSARGHRELAGAAGLEPANAGIKTPCLTNLATSHYSCGIGHPAATRRKRSRQSRATFPARRFAPRVGASCAKNFFPRPAASRAPAAACMKNGRSGAAPRFHAATLSRCARHLPVPNCSSSRPRGHPAATSRFTRDRASCRDPAGNGRGRAAPRFRSALCASRWRIPAPKDFRRLKSSHRAAANSRFPAILFQRVQQR